MNANMKAERVIGLRNVGLSYKKGKYWFSSARNWALKDISFDLYQGETLGVIGRNGVGKSSLLRLLAGIIGHERGEVIRNHGMVSLLSLQVGFLPQLSGRENAILSGILLGLKKTQVEALLPEIMQFSELEAFWEEPVATYSAGMKARLGFSVAIHADPDILLIDEVLGVGDVEFRKKSSAAMRERIRSERTIVLVSHNADMIRKLCDRVVWIEGGKTLREGAVVPITEAYEASMLGGKTNRSR